MGEIKIQDTGYILPTNAGTQASSSNMANSGNAISLKTADFIPFLKRNVQDNPDISTNAPSDIHLGSLQNMQFKLRCKLNTTNSTDMSYVKHLLDMVVTNGYKLMWYQYSASNENNNGQLIYQIALNDLFGHALSDAEKTKFNISDNFYHLHVLFTNIQPAHTGAKIGIIDYELSGYVLKVRTSGLT